MRSRSDSKARMLTTTASLLRRQGYHATGLNQIIKEAKAPKGSLYFHFPGGKEELACAALEGSGTQMQRELTEVLTACTDPRDAPGAVAEHLAGELERSGFTNGCPIATVALEAAADSDPVQAICDRHFGRWQQIIEGYLVQRGVPKLRAGSLATLMLSAFEGALLLSRAHRSADPLRTVGTELRRLFEGNLT